MKTAIVLAGCHEPTDERYKKIVEVFQASGWEKVIFYVPDWNRRTITKLVSDFVESLPGNSQPLTLLGFSMGGLIALEVASSVAVDNLILCSPSGYFKEYESLLTPDDQAWAQEHASDFRQHSAKQAIAEANAKHGYIIAGGKEIKEWSDFKQWIADLTHQTGWNYTELPNTGHEIEAPVYQEAVKTVVRGLD